VCTFVTAVLPALADLARIRAVVGPPTQALRPLVNPSVQRYIGANALYYRAYEGVCDCGVALGGAAYDVRGDRPAEADVAALRRKGWSEAKIGRRLEDKRETAERKVAERQSRAENDLRRWHRLLHTTVQSGASPWIAFKSRSDAAKEVPISQVSDNILRNMDRDVLYVFVFGG
jgi:hypothetical protein